MSAFLLAVAVLFVFQSVRAVVSYPSNRPFNFYFFLDDDGLHTNRPEGKGVKKTFHAKIKLLTVMTPN